MLVCGTRILWVGAVVCWPRILGVGAEGFAGRGSSRLALDIVLLAKTPRSPRCTSFACRGSPRLALKVACWPRILEVAEGRLLAEDLGRCRPFACRGSRRLALKIVRWHMILEIDAQRRLLAEDHRALPRILISGLFAGQDDDPGDRRSTAFAGGGSQSLAEDPDKRLVCRTRMLWICAVVCLPRILKVGAEGFAGRGFSRLALDVFCWPRILEVVAARRLLVEDPGSWP